MNTEAQRARNKRKRDKLREKRRMSQGDAILRFRIDGEAMHFKYPCGLIHPDQVKDTWIHDTYPWCSAAFKDRPGHELEEYSGYTMMEWSTEWVYMTTHEVSSSAHDAICAFVNTQRDFHYVELYKTVLTVQLGGVTRRKVWRGHTCGVKLLERVVFSYARTLLHV